MTDSTPAPAHGLEGVLLKGRYQVEAKLGQGGMATVYTAIDQELGRQVVVKVPLPHFMDWEGFGERFELEVRGLIDNEHPHVVSILARGEHEGVPYLIIQFLKGGSLEDRIHTTAGSRLAAKDVSTWLPKVADALDFIHSKGIVHRDVKPGNILFDERNNVFLSDFGVAKALGQDTAMTAAGFTVGSPEYMAPEQVMSEDLGPPADQYGLGITVYECLAGTLPFTGTNPVEIMMQKRTQAATPLSAHNIPQEISDVVARTLEIKPEDRYESCTAFATALEVAVWSVDPAHTPGMRTPPAALGRITSGTAATQDPLKQTLGGSQDFTGLSLLGHYKVGDRIGKGGMGTVYLGMDTDLGKNVVIKVPHPHFLSDEGFRGRFEREVESLLRLEHPGVVRVLARGEHQGIPFYVLQYMKGGSLSERIDEAPNGRMSVEDVLPWFESTARALDFLHSRGLIHRDIKPGNILFDEYDHAFIADFGVAKAAEHEDTRLTTTHQGVGSPRYMAPEQAGDKFEGTVDQYALATTVFEALAGRTPFPDGTVMEIMIKKMQEQPPLLTEFTPDVKPGVAATVAKALSASADNRFPTCRAFFLAFKRAHVSNQAPVMAPVQAPPPVVQPQPQPQARPKTAPKRGARARKQAPAPKQQPAAPPPRTKAKARPETRPRPEATPPPATRPAPAPAPTAATVGTFLDPGFVLGFVGVWLLARLLPFARFAAPHAPLFDVGHDAWTVLWAWVPTILVVAAGHAWLFRSRGVTPAWAWILATLIGGAMGVAGLLIIAKTVGQDFVGQPLGAAVGALMGLCLGCCQWLALEKRVKRSAIWIPFTILGAAAGGALLEYLAGNTPPYQAFLFVVGSGLLIAGAQLLALKMMAPDSRTSGGGA